MEQTFPAFHTPDVPAAPEFTGSYTLCNHRIFKVGKKPQEDGVQPILHRFLNRDKYMNAWRRVKLLHFPLHARYKTPNVRQAHAASNTGDSLLFPRNHRAFPPAWLGSMFCLPQIPSAASQSHDLLQGLLGSALTQWSQHLWLVAALLGKALTNTSGSSHFPPNCSRSSIGLFSTLMLIMNFFQCQSHIMSYPILIINLCGVFHWLQLKAITSTHGTILFAITHAVFLLEIRLKSLEAEAQEQLLWCCSGEPVFTQQ